jgi:hypothetical protein
MSPLSGIGKIKGEVLLLSPVPLAEREAVTTARADVAMVAKLVVDGSRTVDVDTEVRVAIMAIGGGSRDWPAASPAVFRQNKTKYLRVGRCKYTCTGTEMRGQQKRVATWRAMATFGQAPAIGQL